MRGLSTLPQVVWLTLCNPIASADAQLRVGFGTEKLETVKYKICLWTADVGDYLEDDVLLTAFPCGFDWTLICQVNTSV